MSCPHLNEQTDVFCLVGFSHCVTGVPGGVGFGFGEILRVPGLVLLGWFCGGKHDSTHIKPLLQHTHTFPTSTNIAVVS